MSTRINLSVDEDVPDKLTDLAGSERKRGQYLSDLTQSIHANRGKSAVTQERMEALIDGVLARQAKIRGELSELRDYGGASGLVDRVIALEAQVAAMMAEGS